MTFNFRDASIYSGQTWHYCVLDEGHVLRNPKTKLYAAISSLRSQHRLVCCICQHFTSGDKVKIVLVSTIKSHQLKPEPVILNVGLLLNLRLFQILTGTPVQNTVTDLWALFDWLMPSYLGTYADFNARYLKPINQTLGDQTTDQKCDLATSALNLLHKQVAFHLE